MSDLTLGSDPKGRWQPVRVTLMGPVTLDERDDLAWAECHPALGLAGQTHQLVLLQPRLLYHSLWAVGDGGVPVYVCVTTPEHETSDRLTRTNVTVLDWGEVHAT